MNLLPESPHRNDFATNDAIEEIARLVRELTPYRNYALLCYARFLALAKAEEDCDASG